MIYDPLRADGTDDEPWTWSADWTAGYRDHRWCVPHDHVDPGIPETPERRLPGIVAIVVVGLLIAMVLRWR